MRRDVARRPSPPAISARQADLLDGDATPTDLVVFNPPWIPGPVDTMLERALNYEGDLFERFFDQAHGAVRPQGRVVLVFSNILRLVTPDAPHPIDAELERGRFTLSDKLTRRIRPPKGSGRRTKERVEVWSLAPA